MGGIPDSLTNLIELLEKTNYPGLDLGSSETSGGGVKSESGLALEGTEPGGGRSGGRPDGGDEGSPEHCDEGGRGEKRKKKREKREVAVVEGERLTIHKTMISEDGDRRMALWSSQWPSTADVQEQRSEVIGHVW